MRRNTAAAVDTDPTAVLQRARVLHSERAVAAAIARMARSIETVLADTKPVILAVMHGGIFTAVELGKRWRFPYEVDFVHVTRYANGLTGGELEWRVRPSPALAGRIVLIVDDILDRGTTLRALQDELRDVGVARHYTAALVVKRFAVPIERPAVDFSAFTVDDAYVFGCGMDYQGYWRGLPALYAIPA